MPRRLRAAVLRQIGQELSVEDLKTCPLTTGQVLVRMRYSGICRSQLMEQQVVHWLLDGTMLTTVVPQIGWIGIQKQ